VGVRKGAEAIGKRNEEVAKRGGKGFIPELRVYGDGDMAIFRFLTDEPLDVDFHEVRDTSISKYPIFTYCKKDEEDGYCEYCDDNVPLKRMFMFWAWIDKILHPIPDKDGNWEETKIGSKKMFAEDRNQIVLIRKKFGKGQAIWNQFCEPYEMNGTWKDRAFSYKRSGGKNDINTSYTLMPLDKSPIPEHLKDIMGKLPSLVHVAKGEVERLPDFSITPEEVEEIGEEISKKKTTRSRPTTKAVEQDTNGEEEPDVTVDLEDLD